MIRFLAFNKENWKKKTVLSALLSLFLFALFFGVGYLSNHYNEVYNTPRFEGTTLDMSSFDIGSRKVDYILNGQFEFYYDSWIVTDAAHKEKDGDISLPSHWNDCFSLPPSGFASYKAQIVGAKKGLSLSFVLNSFRVPFRAFINGDLVMQTGTLSKDSVFEGFASGYADTKRPYTVLDDAPLELVFEISYNHVGGFYDAPWLTAESFSENTSRLSQNIISSILLVIGVSLLCVPVVVFLLLSIGKRISGLGVALLFHILLLFNFLASKDGSLLLSKYGFLDYRIAALLCFLTLIGALLIAFLWHQKRSRVQLASGLVILLFSLLLFSFSFTKWSLVFLILLLASLTLFLFYSLWTKEGSFLGVCISSLFEFSMIILAFFELADSFGFLVFGTEGIVSLVLALVILFFMANVFVSLSAFAKKDDELQEDLKQEQMKNLANQMKPHFVFNSLSNIQRLYHEDVEIGDRALTTFSSNLRHRIDSLDESFVPFEEEIENMEQYIALFSYGQKTPVNVLHNFIDVDFEVPPLSFEPFIENALKYAGLEEKQDGFLLIESERKEGFIEVRISDNGIGFDLQEVVKQSHGIKNATHRLRTLLGAEVSICSKKGEGTKVVVRWESKEC